MVMKVEIAIMSFVGCCIHSMMKKRLPNYTPNVRNSLIESGFKDVTIERMDVSFDFDSTEVYTSYVYETAAPIQAMLANQPQERREEILKAITEAARKYAENDTRNVRLSNEAMCIVGTR